MVEDEWLRMGLPPLAVSRTDLRELVEVAGEDGSLELRTLGIVSIGELDDVELAQLQGAKISAPGFSLSFGENALGTELSYEDNEERIAQDELVLKRLEPCRRHAGFLTHGDFAIFAGMLLPLAAGLLAPPSKTSLACGIGAAVWMLYLWWVQGNASRKWCVFRAES
jgi:hypothetical protein